jgi:HTH-type transcriptional regulator/antitoxin HigA
MTAKPATGLVSDDYLDLVRRFPLRPIRDDADYDDAAAVLLNLDTRRENGEALRDGERQYADTLGLLIADYDARHHALPDSVLPLPDRLRGLLDVTDTTQTQLAGIAGVSPGNVSDVMAGRRGFSKPSIKALAAHFRVDVGYFIE